jgi:hypothetical protein
LDIANKGRYVDTMLYSFWGAAILLRNDNKTLHQGRWSVSLSMRIVKA